VSPEILALANPRATFVPARKQRGQQEEVQAEIYAWYLRLRDAAGPIVRLKSGDPLVFGRGGEELEFLTQHGFDVEVVPGVSAVTAAPALAGIPLTYRGVAASFTVLPGHRQAVKEVDWPAYRHAGTLVVLMGVDNRAAIANCLINGGRPAHDPVAFLQLSSTEREYVHESTLEQVARGEVDVEPPAVFVIGEVVRLRTTPGSQRIHETASPRIL
jgi:uroporphyrin-III C-methyltransferase